MERGKDTGFKDKSGRSIHVDDIVQHRLGKFGKASGGPTNRRVIEFHGKYQTVSELMFNPNIGGTNLTNDTCKHLIVFRCDHIPS